MSSILASKEEVPWSSLRDFMASKAKAGSSFLRLSASSSSLFRASSISWANICQNSTKRLRSTKPELFFPPLPSPFPLFFSARSPLPLSSFSFLGDILKTFVHRFAWFDIPPNYLNVFLTQTTKEPVEWFEDMEAKPSSISCSFFSCLSLLLFGSSSSFASNAEEGRVSLRFIFSSFWPGGGAWSRSSSKTH